MGDMCISLIGSNERRLGYKLDPHRSHNGMAVVTGNTVRVRLIELRGNHTLVAGGLASKPNAFGGLHYIDARTMPGQRLIAEMATKNRTWSEERIAAELCLKLGLTVSPRTVRRYMSCVHRLARSCLRQRC